MSCLGLHVSVGVSCLGLGYRPSVGSLDRLAEVYVITNVFTEYLT